MANKQQPKMVKCRYTKCNKLHESQELNREDAVQGGKGSYYHPDCYHMMQTVNQIRDLFCKEINPLMTGQQIGLLVTTINNLVFGKNIDVDYVFFALQWFIKNKPGKLQHPFGLHYVIQNKEIAEAWKKVQESKFRNEIKGIQSSPVVNDEFHFDLPETTTYRHSNKSKFGNVIGG